MKRFPVKPIAPALRETPAPIDPIISDISVDRLIGDCLLALHREVKNILRLGIDNKLDKEDARDLRDTLKALFEIKDREKDFLKALTDEQVQAIMKALNDSPE